MKKAFALVLAAALSLMVLTGCGGKPQSTVSSDAQSVAGDTAETYDLAGLVTAVEQANPVSNPRDVDDNDIKLAMLMTAENIAAYSGKISNDQGNSALILAIQAVEGKAADVKAELEAYKSSISAGGMYAEFAEMEEKARDARIVVKGDCLMLVVANTEGADYAEIDKAIDAALK